MTDDEAALVRAIVADPDNDLPRLVYADWLEEHGRPDEAAVQRSGRNRTELGRTGAGYFGTYYPGIWNRIVYLDGASPALIPALGRGVIFFMAWWSAPARRAFRFLASALRRSDPDGTLAVVAVDVDGITEANTETFNRILQPFSVHLSGDGEGLWVWHGMVTAVTRHGTSTEELRLRISGLLPASTG